MRLLKLEILNLASLDKEGGEVLDFTTGVLGESNIFSIVGPTGSGKSTLLDAICLALYNKAPRYPHKKGDRDKIRIYGSSDAQNGNRLSPLDNRNILTRGKRQGYSKLTFLANNGTVYRAEWHVSMRHIIYNDNVTCLYKIVQHDGQFVEEEAKWEDLPQIIGLDYEQFLRTVLIAQGSFANFLTAKEDERYELLEKIVGCGDTYQRIAELVSKRYDEANTVYSQITASIDAVKANLLNTEQLTALLAQIDELEKAEQALAAEQKRLEEALKWYDEEATLQQNETKARQEAEKAQAALETIREATERLDLHTAILPAVDILREVNRLSQDTLKRGRDIEDKKQSLADQETRIKQENQTLEALQTETQKAKQEKEALTPHILAARTLKTQIAGEQSNLKEKLENEHKADLERKEAEKALVQNAQDITKAKHAEQMAKDALSQTEEMNQQKRQQLAVELTLAQEKLDAESQKIEGQNLEVLLQQQQMASKNLSDIEKAVAVVKALESLAEEQQKGVTRYQNLEKQNVELSAQLKSLTLEKLTQELEALQLSHTLMTCENWEQHRADLEPNMPCPLCGSTEHPYVSNRELFTVAALGLQAKIDEKRAELEQQKTLEKTWSGQWQQNEGQMRQIEQRLQQVVQELQVREANWEFLRQSHAEWPQDSKALEALMPDYQQKCNEATEALKFYNEVSHSLGNLSKAKEKAQKSKEDYEQVALELQTKAQEALSNAINSLTGFVALTPTLETQLESKKQALVQAVELREQVERRIADLKLQFDNELGGKDPDQEEQRMSAACQTAEMRVEKQKEQIAALNNKMNGTKGELQTLGDSLVKEQSELTQQNAALTAWMLNYNAKEDRLKDITLTDVEMMLAATDDWESIRQLKEQRMGDVASTQALLNQAVENHQKHMAEPPQQQREELQTALQSLAGKSHQQELVAAEAKLKNHEDAKSSLGSKDVELQDAKEKQQNWEAIKNAMGSSDGKQLRRIAQCYTLGFLVEHANVEIRKFNQRYELVQVKNSLGIRVIDHDRADDIRDTTSLSGGETFIVSLGLALGLSALSSRNISFENLFIDEGFGTLDPDMLALVIDSLAMLQTSQGKKVGVISHTDTMSERITTQIRVVKHGSSGSSHIEIYP